MGSSANFSFSKRKHAKRLARLRHMRDELRRSPVTGLDGMACLGQFQVKRDEFHNGFKVFRLCVSTARPGCRLLDQEGHVLAVLEMTLDVLPTSVVLFPDIPSSRLLVTGNPAKTLVASPRFGGSVLVGTIRAMDDQIILANAIFFSDPGFNLWVVEHIGLSLWFTD